MRDEPRARFGVAPMCLALTVVAALGSSAACAHSIDPRLVEDARTAVRIKTALVNDPELGTRVIEVRVTRGVAHLSGIVASDAEAAHAVTLARSVQGVVRVEVDLQVRSPVSSERGFAGAAPVEPDDDRDELDISVDPGWLAVGMSGSSRQAAHGRLEGHWTLGPLVRFGSRRGLGLALGFSWFSAELMATATGSESLGRLSVRPVMAGLGYTIRRGRGSVDVSLVGGLAFNRFTLEALPPSEPVPVGVNNSLAWRPAVSVWYDPSRRVALHLSLGYVVTRPGLTSLEAGRLVTRPLRADTAVLTAGAAYKLF